VGRARREARAPVDEPGRPPPPRFLAVAGVLSVLPGTATFPSGRLLFLPGFALVGLVALVCITELEGRVSRAFVRWCWFAHLVIAPFLFVIGLHSAMFIDKVIEPISASIPADGSAVDKRLVLVNAPDTVLADFALFNPPERLLVLTGDRRDVRLTRIDERTVRVRAEGGFTRTGTELLFADPRSPLPVGTRIALADVLVTVTHVTSDGMPDEAQFEFTKALDDAFVFRKWEGARLVPFTLPPIGETVLFAGRLA
jgi:hypothetical protein